MKREDDKKRLANRVRGVALLELASWMVVFLPVLIISTGLFAAVHERNIIQIIPEAFMRETRGGIIRWKSDRAGGQFEVDMQRLNVLVAQFTERALREAKDNLFKIEHVSSRGCFWVFDLHIRRGVTERLRQSGCVDQGPIGSELSLNAALQSRLEAGIAEPISTDSGSVVEYMSPVVLVGVAIGGDFVGMGALYPAQRMQHAAVWVPRGDVVL